VQDVQRHGVEVRPVDVLVSGWECSLEPAQARGKAQPALRLGLLQQAELLIQERAILELAGLLVTPRGPLPSKAGADALHWAVASYYGCEFVLTWNFKHLNNAAIKRRAERIIRDYGYEPPTLCSPEELEGIDMGGDDA